jgi:hypothetical protein
MDLKPVWRVVFKFFFAMDPELERTLRLLLDPRGQGIPRRATLDYAGLVVDATSLQEIDVVSDVCHALFGAELEPRDPVSLVDRAVIQNIPAAWSALRDDCRANRVPDHVWGRISPHHMLAALFRPVDESVVDVCAHILERLDISLDVPTDRWSDLARAISSSDAGRAIMEHLDPSVRDIATILIEAPEAGSLFLGSSSVAVGAAARCDPKVVTSLVAHAAALAPHRRYVPLALLARISSGGSRDVDPAIGVATLVDLKRRAFDAKLAAAAAVIAQRHDDPAIRGMAHVVESLASAVQRQPRRSFQQEPQSLARAPRTCDIQQNG